jgi:hypothetical protein
MSGGRSGISRPVRAVLGHVAKLLPIACTLSAADLVDRGFAWQKLLGSGLVKRDRVPGGIRLTADSSAAASLIQLVDLERECCAWINFDVEGSVVTLTADGDGEAVLASMFEAESVEGS